MKRTALILILAAATIGTIGCGGGKNNLGNPVPPVDPSGNWQLNLGSYSLGVVMNQVGANVTGISFRIGGCSSDPGTLTAAITNGTQMDGQFSQPDLGTINFSGQLSSSGAAFQGTFTASPNTSGCGGTLPTSGQVIGGEVMSLTGNWTGTLQPLDSQGTPTGIAMPFAAALTQNDSNGTVSGTYTVTNSTCFTSGILNVNENKPFSWVRGTAFQYALIDNDGKVDSLGITADGAAVLPMAANNPTSFSGNLTQDGCSGEASSYALSLAKQ